MHVVGIFRSGGIEIRGLSASSITRRKPLADPVLEKYVFVPNEATLSTEQSTRVNLQIVLENNYRLKVKVVEFIEPETPEEQEVLGPIIFSVLGDQPLIHANVVVLSPRSLDVQNVSVINKPLSSESDALLVVVTNGLTKEKVRSSKRGYHNFDPLHFRF